MIPSALTQALPELQDAYERFEAACSARGISIDIADFGGVRTEADTTAILQYRENDYRAALATGAIRPDTTLQQFRPIAPFGRSYHNYGAAFDAIPIVWPTGMTEAEAVKTMGALASSCGLRWGGTFSNPDPPHYELPMSLAEARVRWENWEASGGTDDSLSTTQYVTVQAQNPIVWVALAVVVAVLFGRRRLARA